MCGFSRAMSAAVNQSSAASVVEDVIQHHGEKLSNVDLYAARKAEEACMITSFDQLLFCLSLLIVAPISISLGFIAFFSLVIHLI